MSAVRVRLSPLNQLAEQVQQSELSPEEVNENLFAQHLYTAATKDPDLLIRNQRRDAPEQFPTVANGLYRDVIYRYPLARF